MNELLEQSIEKMTAAQIRGFESFEALKKRYKLEKNKEKPKNVIAELLKKTDEPEDVADTDIELTEAIKEQLQKRKQDQQEVLLKVFRSKIEFSDEDPHKDLRMDKPKFQLPLYKKAKSTTQELELPSMQRAPSFVQTEPKPETVKVEKAMLADTVLGKDELTLKQLIGKKMSEVQKNLDFYYENCQKPKSGQLVAVDFNAEPSTIHPTLNEFETRKREHLSELEVLFHVIFANRKQAKKQKNSHMTILRSLFTSPKNVPTKLINFE